MSYMQLTANSVQQVQFDQLNVLAEGTKLRDSGKELCVPRSGDVFASSRCYVRDRLEAPKHQAPSLLLHEAKEGDKLTSRPKYEQRKCFLVDQPVPVTIRELIGSVEERVAEL